MAKPLVWTVRVEQRPILWITHEGKPTVTFIEQYVAKCKALGHTVVVGLSRRVPAVRRAR
jgi:hypothetical protein